MGNRKDRFFSEDIVINSLDANFEILPLDYTEFSKDD